MPLVTAAVLAVIGTVEIALDATFSAHPAVPATALVVVVLGIAASAWLPVVGDPLCAVAGWLRLPFWPCAGYMFLGKLARYVIYTAVLMHFFPGG